MHFDACSSTACTFLNELAYAMIQVLRPDSQSAIGLMVSCRLRRSFFAKNMCKADTTTLV